MLQLLEDRLCMASLMWPFCNNYMKHGVGRHPATVRQLQDRVLMSSLGQLWQITDRASMIATDLLGAVGISSKELLGAPHRADICYKCLVCLSGSLAPYAS